MKSALKTASWTVCAATFLLLSACEQRPADYPMAAESAGLQEAETPDECAGDDGAEANGKSCDKRSKGKHGKRGHGPGAMIHKALKLELTAAQRKIIEQLPAALKPDVDSHAAMKQTRADYGEALPSGVEPGMLDEPLTRGKLSALGDFMTGKKGRMSSALKAGVRWAASGC